MGVVGIKTGPMDGAEFVAHARWARQRPSMAGATEVGVCKSCRQPFLFNGHVLMPDTCGTERCMIAADEHADLRVLTEGGTPPVAPPRTRRAVPTPEEIVSFPDATICTCVCHAVSNLAEYGIVSDDDAPDTCDHCCV